MPTDKPTTGFAEREQAALRWMYAGVEAGEEPQMTLAAMFQERANAEGRMADEYVRLAESIKTADFYTLLREKRFGVRLMAAFDLLFPAAYMSLGRYLARCPQWLTKASDEDRELMRVESGVTRKGGVVSGWDDARGSEIAVTSVRVAYEEFRDQVMYELGLDDESGGVELTERDAIALNKLADEVEDMVKTMRMATGFMRTGD